MSKRFIDTGLFDDEWFSELKLQSKIFWLYFITKCDHAGFLKYNEKLIKFQTGIQDLPETLKDFPNRIVRVTEQLLFSPKFVDYQYPGFPNCHFKAALSAIEIMKKNGVNPNSYLTLNEQLPNSYETLTELLPNSYGNGNGNGISKGNGNGSSKEVAKKEKSYPELPEVIAYFTENGYTEKAAEKAFRYYADAGWMDSRGNKVRNWKQKMQSVWFKDENKVIEQPKYISEQDVLDEIKRIEQRQLDLQRQPVSNISEAV